jgi:xanthine/CO dehydrogenase XdhC/CoxF family maturation factor
MPHESAMLLSSGLSWLAQGHRVAIATVVKTWGSSPRPPGSLLVISQTRRLSLARCRAAASKGLSLPPLSQTMADGRPQLLAFGVTQELAWEVGLACGGRVEVLGRASRSRDQLGHAHDGALSGATAAAGGDGDAQWRAVAVSSWPDRTCACPEPLRVPRLQEVPCTATGPLDHELADGRRHSSCGRYCPPCGLLICRRRAHRAAAVRSWRLSATST